MEGQTDVETNILRDIQMERQTDGETKRWRDRHIEGQLKGGKDRCEGHLYGGTDIWRD